jgi:hypothetical protein
MNASFRIVASDAGGLLLRYVCAIVAGYLIGMLSFVLSLFVLPTWAHIPAILAGFLGVAIPAFCLRSRVFAACFLALLGCSFYCGLWSVVTSNLPASFQSTYPQLPGLAVGAALAIIFHVIVRRPNLAVEATAAPPRR